MATKFKRRKKTKVKGKTKTKTLPKNFFSVFAKEALLAANKGNVALAESLVKEAKDIIKEQRYNWEPLTKAYSDHKKRNKLDSRIYIATKDYVENIGTFKRTVGGKELIWVGPKPGTHEPSGLSYTKLSRILEFGTLDLRIPARPLWRPLLSAAVRRSKRFKKVYQAAVQRATKQEAKKAKVKKRRV